MKKIINIFLLFPTISLAANDSISDSSIKESSFTNITVALNFIKNYLLGIAGGIAVFFIIYGGIQYIASAGNSQKADAAKKNNNLFNYRINSYNIIRGNFRYYDW